MVLAPAGAHWLRERVVGRVPILLGQSLQGVTARGGKGGSPRQWTGRRSGDLAVDHIIAATGYQFAARSLPFVSEALLLRSALRRTGAPSRFSSSRVRNSASPSHRARERYNFRPVMRFLCGSQYTAERIFRIFADGNALGLHVREH